MPSNAPVMRKAGPITSAGWPRLWPGATRAQTTGMAALDEQTLSRKAKAALDNRPSQARHDENSSDVPAPYLTRIDCRPPGARRAADGRLASGAPGAPGAPAASRSFPGIASSRKSHARDRCFRGVVNPALRRVIQAAVFFFHGIATT